MKSDHRSRISIEIPFDLHNRLNDLLAGWRIKNRLYKALTVELVDMMEKMNAHQRRVFIVAIVESKIGLNEWSKTVREATNEQIQEKTSSN